MPIPLPLISGLPAIIQGLNQLLVQQFNCGVPFRDEGLLPGDRFGLIRTDGIAATADEQSWSDIECTIWVCAAYGGFMQAETGLVQLMANIDAFLERAHLLLDDAIASKPDSVSCSVLDLQRRGRINKSLRAPIRAPNTERSHVWIGDILAPIVIRVPAEVNLMPSDFVQPGNTNDPDNPFDPSSPVYPPFPGTGADPTPVPIPPGSLPLDELDSIQIKTGLHRSTVGSIPDQLSESVLDQEIDIEIDVPDEP